EKGPGNDNRRLAGAAGNRLPPHPGKTIGTGTAGDPHQERLGLVVAMVGGDEVRCAFPPCGREKERVTGLARGRLDTGSRGRSFPDKDTAIQSACLRDPGDHRGLIPRARAQAVIDAEDDGLRAAPLLSPAVDAVEEGERVGAAGDRQGNLGRGGERGEKRIEFRVAERGYRISSWHLPVRRQHAGGAPSTRSGTASGP